MCAQYKPSLIAIQYFNTIFLVCSVILCQRLTVPLPVCLFLTIVNRGLFKKKICWKWWVILGREREKRKRRTFSKEHGETRRGRRRGCYHRNFVSTHAPWPPLLWSIVPRVSKNTNPRSRFHQTSALNCSFTVIREYNLRRLDECCFRTLILAWPCQRPALIYRTPLSPAAVTAPQTECLLACSTF